MPKNNCAGLGNSGSGLTFAAIVCSCIFSTSLWAAPKTAKATPSPVKNVKEEKKKPDAPAKTAPKVEDRALFNIKSSDEPTYISSDSLTLNSQSRTFSYSGHVEVTQGDMKLTADVMDGKYTEQNKIQEIVARKSVTITKGPGIKATSERAVYDAAKETVTLLENPQLYEDGSVLTADVVKVYLNENRSVAEGQVRMKLIKGTGSSADLTKKAPKPEPANG